MNKYENLLKAYEMGKHLLPEERSFCCQFYFKVEQFLSQYSWKVIPYLGKMEGMTEQQAEMVYGIGKEVIEDINSIRFIRFEGKWIPDLQANHTRTKYLYQSVLR